MILFKKDGTIIYNNDINPKHEDYICKEVSSCIPYLRHRITLEDGFTMEDFFNIVEKDKENIEFVFSSYLGSFPLQPYIDEIKKDREENDDNELSYLEVYWGTYYMEYKGKTSFDFSPELHGWGAYKEKDGGGEGGYAIEYTPLNNLKHLPIKLRETFVVYGDDFDKEKNEFNVLLEAETPLCAHDVIRAILFEISWAGFPEDRDKIMKDIEEEGEEIEKRIANGEKFKSVGQLPTAKACGLEQ